MKDGRMNVVVMYFRVYFFVPNRESHVREIQVALLDESQLQQNCTIQMNFSLMGVEFLHIFARITYFHCHWFLNIPVT